VVYSAVGARTWLTEVGIVARLGNDYPEEHLRALAERGFALAVRRVDRPNMHTWGLYEEGGFNQFVNHIASSGHYEMSIRPEDIEERHRNAEAYHVASMPTDIQLGLVRALKRSRSLVSVDPHADYVRRGDAALETILGMVDCFLPSREEAQLAYGADRPEEAARSFAAAGPRAVAVKLAAEGSLVYDREAQRMVHVPAIPVKVADVTGAGDAYCGGFMAGMLLTGDPLEAALFATVSASYAVESSGALGVGVVPRDAARSRLEELRIAVAGRPR
jgi:ribokinase